MLAEQYILPAWQAGGTGDEAEHLGEIYEKRGKRDEAIHYYVLALAVEDPSPDARGRLTALGVTDIDRRMTPKPVPELQKQRTLALSQSGQRHCRVLSCWYRRAKSSR